MHGYGFNVIGIGRSPDTNVKKINLKHALDLDRRGLLHRQYNLPPLKDTIAVPNNGYVVLRFRADNPGKFIFFLLEMRKTMSEVIHKVVVTASILYNLTFNLFRTCTVSKPEHCVV